MSGGDLLQTSPGLFACCETRKLSYLSMNFVHGPVFSKFLVYKTQESWIVSGKYNFHTEPEQVLPEAFLDIKR